MNLDITDNAALVLGETDLTAEAFINAAIAFIESDGNNDSEAAGILKTLRAAFIEHQELFDAEGKNLISVSCKISEDSELSTFANKLLKSLKDDVLTRTHIEAVLPETFTLIIDNWSPTAMDVFIKFTGASELEFERQFCVLE